MYTTSASHLIPRPTYTPVNATKFSRPLPGKPLCCSSNEYKYITANADPNPLRLKAGETNEAAACRLLNPVQPITLASRALAVEEARPSEDSKENAEVRDLDPGDTIDPLNRSGFRLPEQTTLSLFTADRPNIDHEEDNDIESQRDAIIPEKLPIREVLDHYIASVQHDANATFKASRFSYARSNAISAITQLTNSSVFRALPTAIQFDAQQELMKYTLRPNTDGSVQIVRYETIADARRLDRSIHDALTQPATSLVPQFVSSLYKVGHSYSPGLFSYRNVEVARQFLDRLSTSLATSNDRVEHPLPAAPNTPINIVDQYKRELLRNNRNADTVLDGLSPEQTRAVQVRVALDFIQECYTFNPQDALSLKTAVIATTDDNLQLKKMIEWCDHTKTRAHSGDQLQTKDVFRFLYNLDVLPVPEGSPNVTREDIAHNVFQNQDLTGPLQSSVAILIRHFPLIFNINSETGNSLGNRPTGSETDNVDLVQPKAFTSLRILRDEESLVVGNEVSSLSDEDQDTHTVGDLVRLPSPVRRSSDELTTPRGNLRDSINDSFSTVSQEDLPKQNDGDLEVIQILEMRDIHTPKWENLGLKTQALIQFRDELYTHAVASYRVLTSPHYEFQNPLKSELASLPQEKQQILIRFVEGILTSDTDDDVRSTDKKSRSELMLEHIGLPKQPISNEFDDVEA